MTKGIKKLIINQEYTEEFNKEFMDSFFSRIENLPYQELEVEKEEIESKLVDLTITIDEELKAAITKFIYLEDSQLSFGLGDWILIRTIRDKQVGDTLSYVEYHNLTEYLKKARVVNPDSIDVCLDLLDMTFELNKEIGSRQWMIQQLASLIVKKLNELKHGLEHAEGDFENTKQLETSK